MTYDPRPDRDVVSSHELSEQRKRFLILGGKILDEFRKLNPTMPVAQIQAFLLVALDSGRGMTELSEELSVKPSTASRYLLDLGERRLPDEKTYGLVERGVDKFDPRKANYRLTRKGKKLVDDILRIIANGRKDESGANLR